MAVVYINGKLYSNREDAKISVWDHGFLYGDGVFEGIRVYNGRIFKCQEHLRRLYDSAKTLNIKPPMSMERLEHELIETIKYSEMRDCYIRLIISRGTGDLGLNPLKCPEPTVVIIVDTITLFPAEMYEKGVEIVTASTRKNSSAATNPNVKSLNYLNNILAKIEANRAGAAEAIMLNMQGYITEGSADNVFIVRDGVVKTPPTYAGILVGITRNLILEICRENGIPALETNLTLFDVYAADEVFLTGTAVEMIPVIDVDGRTIGEGKPGPMFKKLLGKLRARTGSEGTPVWD